jgi:DNA-binding response OmpR family regulator
MNGAEGTKILFIEDNLHFAEKISAGLRTKGFEILHVATVEAARAILATDSFDICVTDFQIANTDILETIPTVRGKFEIPVIVVSAHDYNTPVPARCLERGVVDFATKKVNGECLVERIHESIMNTLIRRSHASVRFSKEIIEVPQISSLPLSLIRQNFVIALHGRRGSGKSSAALALAKKHSLLSYSRAWDPDFLDVRMTESSKLRELFSGPRNIFSQATKVPIIIENVDYISPGALSDLCKLFSISTDLPRKVIFTCRSDAAENTDKIIEKLRQHISRNVYLQSIVDYDLSIFSSALGVVFNNNNLKCDEQIVSELYSQRSKLFPENWHSLKTFGDSLKQKLSSEQRVVIEQSDIEWYKMHNSDKQKYDLMLSQMLKNISEGVDLQQSEEFLRALILERAREILGGFPTQAEIAARLRVSASTISRLTSNVKDS